MQIVITEGKAYIGNSGLRCMNPRADNPDLKCNKLIVKKNAVGELSGNFICPDRRCKQHIEVLTIK
jgi:hypothetical protein